MMPRREQQSFSPWDHAVRPGRILIIRLHALGDLAITLPASASLRRAYPEAEIDILSLDDHAPFLRSLHLFDQVLLFPRADRRGIRLGNALRVGRFARSRGYDVVFDLQRNWISRLVRRMASPPAWGEFDRFDLRPASDRVQEVFHRTGFRDIVPDNSLPVNSRFKAEALQLLTASGWANGERIVLLNPGGLWETRHWPLDHYVDLAQLWMDNEPVRFVFVGTERIRTRAAIVAGRIGGRAIDLTGQTSLGQALAVLQCCTCVISEDSGLLHLAWAAGVPVVALFGSSRHVWSAPTGPKARVFHSGDLPCGQCMHASCRYGDVHCLSRVTPGMVYTSAREMTATAVLEGDHR